MGLDIIHYKATLEKAKANHLFYIGEGILTETGAEIREKFNGFNVDFDHFKKYIQEIELPILIDTVIIVKGKEHLNLVKEPFKNSYRHFFIKDAEHDLEKQLNNFEKERGYQGLKKSLEDIEYEDWMILKYYRTLKKEGFYFKEVAAQRKGMNNEFHKKFCSGEHNSFALKEDVDFALSCVDYYFDSDTKMTVKERLEEFKKQFVDNFELGASFMVVSY